MLKTILFIAVIAVPAIAVSLLAGHGKGRCPTGCHGCGKCFGRRRKDN
ncbi:hypothetical protein JonanDRAFT_0773 [Jonquetella anthropi DSM 22815]|uniref:FeoB-associated Cys-rich membrane protein n=1 Tax=Jonquetella anthropi DSM 22815 TaxID=885272 RepID=H0UKE4_9BACT|nr:hypothetical protein [Jonquetella anthropi]EHM13153.1 hypothetical protein JonanDRAFT_0773 [Jonquetella anthropi DSM 22815]